MTKDFDSDGVTSNEVNFYGEIYEQFSLEKIFGLDFHSSFISDVGLNVGINAGQNQIVGLIGSRIDFNVPSFNALSFAGYAYKNLQDPFERDLDTTYQFTGTWNATLINQGRFNIWTQGFIDFIGDQGPVNNQWLWQPQLRMDLGQIIGGTPGRLEAGFEFSWWDNKFGVKGARDRILQLMLVYNFH